MKRILFALVLSILLAAPVAAQEETAMPVTIESGDLAIVGDYYPAEAEADAVLLLHMLSSRRSAWEPLIVPLTDAGYAVLAVDMRGHGDTGGTRDWDAAQQDTLNLLAWLRQQPNVRSTSVVGGSIGANLALMGCAADTECATVVALSPGADYVGVRPGDALIDGLADRPVLLVASQDDRPSGTDVKAWIPETQGDVGVRVYAGRAHGTNIFGSQPGLAPLILSWLDEHLTVDV